MAVANALRSSTIMDLNHPNIDYRRESAKINLNGHNTNIRRRSALFRNSITTLNFIAAAALPAVKPTSPVMSGDNSYKSFHYNKVDDSLLHHDSANFYTDYYLRSNNKLDNENKIKRLPYQRYTLIYAIKRGYFNLVRVLLDMGMNPNGVNKKEDHLARTPLIYCTFIKDEKWALSVAQTLIEYGADLKLTDANKLTVFHYCCAFGRFKLLELLLNSLDFDLTNVCDLNGNTCLHYAVWNRNKAVIELLLNKFKSKHFYDDNLKKFELENKFSLKPIDLEDVNKVDNSNPNKPNLNNRYNGSDSFNDCKALIRNMMDLLRREQLYKKQQIELLKRQKEALDRQHNRKKSIKINNQVAVRKINKSRKSSTSLDRESASTMRKNSKSPKLISNKTNEDSDVDLEEDNNLLNRILENDAADPIGKSVEFTDYVKVMKPTTPVNMNNKFNLSFINNYSTTNSDSQLVRRRTSSRNSQISQIESNDYLVKDVQANKSAYTRPYTALPVKTMPHLDAQLLANRCKSARSIFKENIVERSRKSFNLLTLKEFNLNQIEYNDLFLNREGMLENGLTRQKTDLNAPNKSLNSRSKSAIANRNLGNQDFYDDFDRFSTRSFFNNEFEKKPRILKLSANENKSKRSHTKNSDSKDKRNWKTELNFMYKIYESNLSTSYRKTIKPPVSTKIKKPQLEPAHKSQSQLGRKTSAAIKRSSILSSSSSNLNTLSSNGLEPYDTTSIGETLSMRKKT